MATLNIDIEKATKKIYEETHSKGDDRWARQMANQLKNYHPDLFPIIEAWLDGEEREFEFQGITLSYIRKKQGSSYLSALASMSVLLKGLIAIESYKEIDYMRK